MWSPGFHVVNVLLHTLVTSLYTYACCCAGTGYVVAVVAGVLFASHPIHTEAVSREGKDGGREGGEGGREKGREGGEGGREAREGGRGERGRERGGWR